MTPYDLTQAPTHPIAHNRTAESARRDNAGSKWPDLCNVQDANG
jgi:hypothetical protein